MKHLATTLLAIGLGFTTTPFGYAENPGTTVSSEVAGFLAFDIPGAGSPQAPQLAYKSVGLVNRVEYQGTSTLIRGKLLKDTEATWTNDQFNPPGAKPGKSTHCVEITSGPSAGVIVDIVRTDSARKVLVLGQPLPGKSGPKATYRIRRHWTLATLFGAANEVGLRAGDAGMADQISIYNGKGYDVFYYSDAEAGTGWRRVGKGDQDQAGYVIYPDDGLLIRRHDETPLNAIVTGIVKAGRTTIPVHLGTNLIGNVYPSAVTLADSRLYTGSPATGVRSGNAKSADKVLIYNGTDFDTYYYQANTLGRGWRKSGDPHTDAGATEIPAGGAFMLKRGGRIGFNWKAAP